MWEDTIVEEVRKVREEHAAKFNFDIDEIFRDLQQKQKNNNNKIVSYINGEYIVIDQSKEL